MNIDNQTIIEKLSAVRQVLARFAPVLLIIIVVSVYSGLILYVNNLTIVAVDDDEVIEMLEITTRPQIDQQAVNAIEALQDQNIQIESLFEEARDNPFAENVGDE